MGAASCLVTSIPDFEDAEQTPPILLAETALPDNRQLLIIDSEADRQTFQAEVTSANDKDEDIRVRLIVDYGVPRFGSDYYTALIATNPSVPPQTDATQPRKATATWNQGSPGLTGCHTFTLMVSHRFDEVTGCPEDLADSSEITWLVYVCEGAECQVSSVDLSSCPKPERRCPQIPDDVHSGDGGGAP